MSKIFSSKFFLFAVSCVLIGLVIGCAQKKEPADLVLMNGKIVTMDESKPEVESLAARDGVIVAVGSTNKVEAYMGDRTEVINLEGKLAIPGFIESHGHFTGIGEAQLRLDLMKVKNWDEIVAMVEEAVGKAKPGEWIFGRGWHQEKMGQNTRTQRGRAASPSFLERSLPG